MESLILLIPLSVLAVAVAAWFFFRMSDSGQFDDTQSPAWSVILDDDRPQNHPVEVTPGDSANLQLDTNTPLPHNTQASSCHPSATPAPGVASKKATLPQNTSTKHTSP